MSRRAARSLLFAAAAVTSISCSRRDASPARDSAADSTPAPGAATSRTGEWASELGQLLVVPSDNDSSAVVLFPLDPSTQLIGSGAVTLVNSAGDTSRVRLAPSDSQCGDAQVVRVAGSLPSAWSVGLLGRSAKLLRMDSIEALPSADSARLAADLARLASALPNGTSRFTGLPFAVLAARRFESDSREILAAQLVRRLNQEAAPQEERTFIVAERAAGTRESYTLTYSQRSEGSEDAAEHFEVLSALRGRQAPMLLLARDRLTRTTYELIERQDDGTWRVRWSRLLAC